MRDYARISPRFWTGETGKALRRNPDAQRLALYLLTCPGANMIGVFYVAAPTICHEVGLDAAELVGLWVVLEQLDFAHYDEATEMVWIPNMAREQLDDALKPLDKRVVQVVRQVDSIRRHKFARSFWERYAEPFSLAAHPEATGLVTLFATPCQGVTNPLPMGKPPRKEEQDQEKELEQELEKGTKEDSPEPGGPDLGPVASPVLTFPCSGGSKTWVLFDAQVEAWSELYPAADVLAECRKAMGWIQANPDRRKTARGMPAFLARWLGKCQDRGGASPIARAGPAARSDGNLGVLENFLAKGTG